MGTEGTAAAPAGPQGLLLGFMGSRCCRSTVSAYSTCPLNQSSVRARRPSGHLPSWQSPRGRKGAKKTNKSSETCRVKRFPLPGDGTTKAPLARCGAHPRCAGELGAGPASPRAHRSRTGQRDGPPPGVSRRSSGDVSPHA